MGSVIDQIANPLSKTFRKAFIKRRLQGTGQFEADWQEITEDVKRWGKISISTTPERPGTFRFNTIKLKMANDEGRYNPATDQYSLWFGYVDMQRTLVKIEYGFYEQTKSGGIWTTKAKPENSYWDVDQWDDDLAWDEVSTSYHGIISGDPDLSDNNEIVLTIKPLTQVFRDYPARLITGYTSTGMAASEFMTTIRDHADSASNYIFRPFFGDTTTNWDIDTTTINYGDLNTSTAEGVIDKTVWQVMEKLAQAESKVPFADNNGVFRFKDVIPTSGTSTSFHFGRGFFNPEYGNTIKTIGRFGPRIEAYYSRTEVKFEDANTSTSYQTVESDLSVTSSNDAWVFGYRTFKVENLLIPDLTTAASIATNLFNDLSSLKKEITWNASFIPHVKILDKVEISYDATEANTDNNWDENDWTTELEWDSSRGDAIVLQDAPFTILKVEIDLDNFGTKFTAREV